MTIERAFCAETLLPDSFVTSRELIVVGMRTKRAEDMPCDKLIAKSLCIAHSHTLLDDVFVEAHRVLSAWLPSSAPKSRLSVKIMQEFDLEEGDAKGDAKG